MKRLILPAGVSLHVTAPSDGLERPAFVVFHRRRPVVCCLAGSIGYSVPILVGYVDGAWSAADTLAKSLQGAGYVQAEARPRPVARKLMARSLRRGYRPLAAYSLREFRS